MNRDVILEKARSSQSDEREVQIKINSFRIGWLGVSAVMLILIAIRAYFNEFSIEIVIILLAQTGATSFYQYNQKSKDRQKYMVAGVVSILGVLFGFYVLLSQYGVFR